MCHHYLQFVKEREFDPELLQMLKENRLITYGSASVTTIYQPFDVNYRKPTEVGLMALDKAVTPLQERFNISMDDGECINEMLNGSHSNKLIIIVNNPVNMRIRLKRDFNSGK